jgi:hypothetical protein
MSCQVEELQHFMYANIVLASEEATELHRADAWRHNLGCSVFLIK